MCSLRERISNADDSFTRLREETRQKYMEETGQKSIDESVLESLLTKRVLTDFIKRCAEFKKVSKVNDGGVKFFNAAYKKKRSIRKRPGKVSESLIQLGRSLTERKPEEEEEVENRRKKKRKIVERPEQDLEPTMPEKFERKIKKMNGIKTMFVMKKRLTRTDVARKNNRLSIPRKEMRNCDFVNKKEMKILDEKEGIKVDVVTPSMEIVELKLKKWVMGSTYTYNLVGGWIKKVVDKEANKLQLESSVKLWSFRQDSKLCFVLDNEGR